MNNEVNLFNDFAFSSWYHPVKGGKLLFITIAIGSALFIFPTFLFYFPPFQDFPLHAALSKIAWEYNSNTFFQENFTRYGWINFFSFFRFITGVLAQFTGYIVATKIYISFYFILLPLGLALWLRSLGKNSWLSLTAFIVIINPMLLWGFLTYCEGISLWLIAMGLFCYAERKWSFHWELILSFLSILIFLTHALVFFIWVFFLFFWLITGSKPLYNLKRLRILIPSIILLLIWGISNFFYGKAYYSNVFLKKLHLVQNPLIIKLSSIPQNLFIVFRYTEIGDILFIFFLFILLIIIYFSNSQNLKLSIRLIVTTFFLLIFYFLLFPVHINRIYWIYPRLVLPALITLILWPEGIKKRIFNIAVIIISIISIANGVLYFKGLQDFQKELSPFKEIIHKIPKGKRLCTLIFKPQSKVFAKLPYLHFGAYNILFNGGTTSRMFVGTGITWKNPLLDKLGSKFEAAPKSFRWKKHAKYFDYFLIRGKVPDEIKNSKAILVSQGGKWHLYKKPFFNKKEKNMLKTPGFISSSY
ncbi:MAG: hypothetical protein JRI44_01475 [Deltaproteobacteria bacterium]|nr:hypothetical protein [Deltaproteobacteria bacterium]